MHEQQQLAEHEQLTEEQRIRQHILASLLEKRSIDHGTARAIAIQLHGGQDSALYALASSGAITEGLGAELDDWRTDDASFTTEIWLDALDDYLDKAPTSHLPPE